MLDASISGGPHTSDPIRIGFIGLGVMGRPMAHNLLHAGHQVVVHSRSPGPVRELVSAGAEHGRSPADIAAQTDVVITMLPDTPDLEAVVAGPDGLLDAARPNTLIVDMSSVDPIATRHIARDFAMRGVGFIDAPVSGGEKGAIDASLSIMVGGADSDVARAMPILMVLGRTIVHVGAVGAGQVTKAANQLVVGVTIQAVAEALCLAEAAGVDPAKVREVLGGGFAASRVLDVHGQRMLEGNFKPGFRATLQLKDAKIIERIAASLDVPTPALQVVLAALERLSESGRGDLDHSALYLLVAHD